MKTTATVLSTTACSLLLASAAFAQSSDTKYCYALSDTYLRYASASQEHKGMRPRADINEAIANCEAHAATSIPVLEKALQNGQVTLPPRL